jgi:hypothetical protein
MAGMDGKARICSLVRPPCVYVQEEEDNEKVSASGRSWLVGPKKLGAERTL